MMMAMMVPEDDGDGEYNTEAVAVAGCRGSPSRQPLVPHLVPFSGQQGHGNSEHEFKKVKMITHMLTGCYFGEREYLGIFCGHIATN